MGRGTRSPDESLSPNNLTNLIESVIAPLYGRGLRCTAIRMASVRRASKRAMACLSLIGRLRWARRSSSTSFSSTWRDEVATRPHEITMRERGARRQREAPPAGIPSVSSSSVGCGLIPHLACQTFRILILRILHRTSLEGAQPGGCLTRRPDRGNASPASSVAARAAPLTAGRSLSVLGWNGFSSCGANLAMGNSPSIRAARIGCASCSRSIALRRSSTSRARADTGR